MASKEVNRTSKVVRLHKDTLAKLERYKDKKRKSWDSAVENVLTDVSTQTLWAVPSSLYKTQQEARTVAMEQAISEGLEYEDTEQPVKVKRVK